MVKKKRMFEVTVCDICGKEIRWANCKCVVCNKDVCDDCNPIFHLEFQARRFTLCPEHTRDLSLTEFIERIKSLA